LSTSPEIHANHLDAFLTPNSNYDLSLIYALFAALIEMAQALGDTASQTRWQDIFDHLDEVAVEIHANGSPGALKLSRMKFFRNLTVTFLI
jgi:alpha-L-fucosidase 2